MRRGRVKLDDIAAATMVTILALLAALWLAVHRPDIAFETLQGRYAVATSQYLDLPSGEHVHVRDVGPRSGTPLVLVHGYAASDRDWDAWIARLSISRRVVALDLPGHGLTRTPRGYRASAVAFERVVDQVTTALALPPFVIVGNSMGGDVAWRYALDHPERLKGLVLIDAAGWPEKAAGSGGDGGGGAILFDILKTPVGRSLIAESDVTPMARQGLKAAFVDETLVTPQLVRRYTDLSRAPGHRRILLNIEQGPPASTQRLAAIHTPTLVLVGEQDRLIPAADGKRFADAIPGAKLIAYSGVGHVPMEQIPDRSVADVQAWLAERVDAP